MDQLERVEEHIKKFKKALDEKHYWEAISQEEQLIAEMREYVADFDEIESTVIKAIR